jgi:hypothetical protein
VHVLARSPWHRTWTWLVAPQPIRLRPLVTGLAAAAVLAIVLFAWPDRPTVTRGHQSVTARFVYVAPQAVRVAVTGDFARWDPEGIALTRGPGGVWVGEIELQPGVHHYVFVVDGTRWEPDPSAPSRVADGFGSENSVLVVSEPERSS